MVKTTTLTGAETEITGLGGQNVAVKNLSGDTVYASPFPNVTAGADYVCEIPAGAGEVVLDAHGTVYLLGTGKVQCTGTPYAFVNFKQPSSGGGSGGGGDDIDNAIKRADAATARANAAADNVDAALQDAEQAVQTAETAATNAEQAVEAANEAVTAAQTAKTEADKATQTATDAAGVATLAAGAANDAAAKATAAVEEISEAVTNAETAVQNAQQAVTDAQTAIDNANTATDTANSAAEKAEQAATKATEAIEGVTDAVQNAETATAGANTAAQSANTAADSANKAAQSVTEALAGITEATESATEAASTATTAAEQATTAAQGANTAKESAESAAQSATTAAASAESATESATAATTSATEAAQKAEDAAKSVDTAIQSATTATENANTATESANTAASAANAAAEAANALISDIDAEPTADSEKLVKSGGVYSALQRKVNPNLLDNWYFGNPVNQRGQTEYTDTKTGAYTIDRWYCVQTSVSVGTKGQPMTVSAALDSTEPRAPRILEKLEHTFAEGTALTASIYAKIPTCTGRWVLTVSDNLTIGNQVLELSESTEYKIFSTTVIAHSGGIAQPAIDICCPTNYANANITMEILAVKLELGTEQTLAHKEGDKWVLNEIPNYAEELAKCQRYQLVIGGANNRYSYIGWAMGRGDATDEAVAFINLPTPLRINPTISFTGNLALVSDLKVSASLIVTELVTHTTNNSAVGITVGAKASGVEGGLIYVLRAHGDATARIILDANL